MSFGVGDHLAAGLAGLGAGLVNALAGGGTLISFPTLVAIGAPAINANVTSTVALCPGYFGGAYSQRATLGRERARLRALAVAAALGGLTGSILLVTTDEALFERLVPWLILLACASLALQQRLRAARRSVLVAARPGSARLPSVDRGNAGGAAVMSTFVVSIYGGYFGAGLGIMVLAVLGLMYDDELTRLNAMKQLLALVVNVVAALFFIGDGKVLWSLAAVMAPASLAGGVVGGRVAGAVDPRVLRAGVVTVGAAVSLHYLLG